MTHKETLDGMIIENSGDIKCCGNAGGADKIKETNVKVTDIVQIYLAGAMTNHVEKGMEWRNKLKKMTHNTTTGRHINFIDPFEEEYKTTGMSFEDSYAHVQNLLKENKYEELKTYMNRIHTNNLKSIMTSDYTFVMVDEGFAKSVGTHIELEQSHQNNIPIYFLFDNEKLKEEVSVWIYFFQANICMFDNVSYLFQEIYNNSTINVAAIIGNNSCQDLHNDNNNNT